MKISLDALAMLDAIDTQGSFAAAAEALHRVPSALTHAVRKLEDDLGFAVYRRVGRRAELTEAGRTLLDDGRVLLRAARELELRAKRVSTGWEAELRIALDSLLDIGHLLPLVAEFYASAGGTRLRLSQEVLAGVWDALVADRADLVIGAPGDPPPGGGLITQPFGQMDMLFCVAPHHPLAGQPEPLQQSLVRQYRAIVVADTARQLDSRTSGLLDGQDTLIVPDIPTKARAQEAGLGVGYLPRPLAEAGGQQGRLVLKQVVGARPAVPMSLAWRASHRGRALNWFVARLQEPGCAERFLRCAEREH